jgi:hypothetical protein
MAPLFYQRIIDFPRCDAKMRLLFCQGQPCNWLIYNEPVANVSYSDFGVNPCQGDLKR